MTKTLEIKPAGKIPSMKKPPSPPKGGNTGANSPPSVDGGLRGAKEQLNGLNDLIEWLQSEVKCLTMEMHRCNVMENYFHAAKAKGARDACLKVLNKLEQT